MQLNDLVAKFKAIYDVDLEETPNDIFLEQCVNKISVEYPNLKKGNVVTVAGQERYTVNHADLIKVSKVYYTGAHNQDEIIPSCALPSSGSLSARFTSLYEDAMYGKLNPVDAEIINYNAFDLIPAPQVSDVKVYYEYEAYRTLAEIPDVFEEILVKFFFYFERENAFQKSMKATNGNVFNFDRRGNIQSNTSMVNEKGQTDRDLELGEIMKSLRTIIMRLKR